MRRVIPIARILLGLVFVVFGLNYFLNFLPAPTWMPAPALAFLGPFVAAKYMGLVNLIEITAGILLLANRFVPLALTLLAPILVAIVHFHLMLEPSGLPVPLVLVALELVLARAYRSAFAPMLHARVAPTEGDDRAIVSSNPSVSALASSR
jgi:uncharacterized membrane protein YphA (DoxX/SURF4 family)